MEIDSKAGAGRGAGERKALNGEGMKGYRWVDMYKGCL